MRKSLFEFELPQELIAQEPEDKREESRLLVVFKDGNSFIDLKFGDIKNFLKSGDLLVVNNTKVYPVRLIGERENKKKIDMLLVKKLNDSSWGILAKKMMKLKKGEKIVIGEDFYCIVDGVDDEGHRIVKIFSKNFERDLFEYGKPPLPPYIKRNEDDSRFEMDKERYQTVYAKKGFSIAAPTAGLHFTESLIEELKTIGVEIAEITLNVGEATFQPVKVDKIEKHNMKEEIYEITEETAEKIEKALKDKRRIIAVGTTTVRTLESAFNKGKIKTGINSTSLFIYPGYRFKVVSGIITNFHLPGSTLIMLVSAFAGIERIKRAYSYAIEKRYRFFSYGDAMLII